MQFADRQTAQHPLAANWGCADRQLVAEPVSVKAPSRDKMECAQPWVAHAVSPRAAAELRGPAPGATRRRSDGAFGLLQHCPEAHTREPSVPTMSQEPTI